MTPKEALKEIFNGMYNKQGFIKEFKVIEQALNDLERIIELAKRRDFIAFENWLECENELTELKCDVKRYFELATNDEITEEVLEEFSKIRDKLMEGGKEE